MKILVMAGRTARQRWTSGGAAELIVHALAQRSHQVTLAAQSIDDPARFGDCAQVRAFDTFDQTATDWPVGFAAWARQTQRDVPHEVCLSLSRVICGDVWLPIEPSGAAWLARARASLGIKSFAIALVRHHGFLRAMASDAYLALPPGPLPLRVLAIGSMAHGEASRRLYRVKGLGDRVVRIDPFWTPDASGNDLRRPTPDVHALRKRTRELLGIGPERRVLAMSLAEPAGPQLDALLQCVGDLAQRDPQHGPAIIAMAKECVSLHTRAVRNGADAHVKIVGLTTQPEAVLAAADIAVLPTRAGRGWAGGSIQGSGTGGLFESGGMSRFACDALRAGKPLLALSGAIGYDLARARSDDQDQPGLVIDYPTRESWMRALRIALDDAWIASAQNAARAISQSLTLDRFLGTLEAALQHAADERRDPRLGGV